MRLDIKTNKLTHCSDRARTAVLDKPTNEDRTDGTNEPIRSGKTHGTLPHEKTENTAKTLRTLGKYETG
jgi:hypothetical protein